MGDVAGTLRALVGVALTALVGCRCGEGPPEEIVAAGAAVEAWREGRRALDDGRPDQAIEHFRAALEARPGDDLLRTWEAVAWQQKGESGRALALLDEAIGNAPGLGSARYLRAQLRASEDPAGAASDLAAALRAGVTTRHRARRDPDLAPLLGHPAASFLPKDPLSLVQRGPEDAVFRGGEFALSLEIQGLAEGVPWSVSGTIQGPARLIKVQEEEVVDGAGEPGVRLTWVLRSDGPGLVRWDPTEVSHEGAVVRTAAMEVSVLGPEAPGVVRAWDLPVPSQVLGARPVPSAWVEQGARWAAWPATARLRSPGLEGRAWRLERPAGVVELGALSDAEAPVVVVQEGHVLWTSEPAGTGDGGDRGR